jgi:hypothetical protein
MTVTQYEQGWWVVIAETSVPMLYTKDFEAACRRAALTLYYQATGKWLGKGAKR